jgi:hypothetical protein
VSNEENESADKHSDVEIATDAMKNAVLEDNHMVRIFLRTDFGIWDITLKGIFHLFFETDMCTIEKSSQNGCDGMEVTLFV